MKLVRRSKRKNQLCTGILVTIIVCFFSILLLSPDTRSQPSVLTHYIYSNSFRSLLSSQSGHANIVSRSLTHSKPLIDFHGTVPPILDESGYFVRKERLDGLSDSGQTGLAGKVPVDLSGDSATRGRGNVGKPAVIELLESKISQIPQMRESHNHHHLLLGDIDLEGDYLQVHQDTHLSKLPGKVTPPRILIVTNRRSGSSFLGQLFNQNRKVFFNFEPLKVLERHRGVYANQTVFLNLLLSCKFKLMPHLMEFYNKERLHRASSLALTSPPLCTLSTPVNSTNVKMCEKLHPSYSSSICSTLYNYTAAKLIRLYSISDLQELVTLSNLNLKIIHLIRDPRGILSSRARVEKRTLMLGKSLDGEAGYLCRRMRLNIQHADTHPPWIKGRYLRVRYEDIAYEPERLAREIYKFTGLGEVPSEVLSWIRTNTYRNDISSSSGSKEQAYSTHRNSKETAEAWRRNISLPVAERIGEICAESLRLMNYKHVTSEKELSDLQHSLVEPLS